MTRRPALLLAALSLLTSGCATVIRGSTDTVAVTADRDSAFVFVDGVAAGRTPAEIPLRRSRSHRIDVVRDSFQIARTRVDRTFNPAIGIGSFLLGGTAGIAIDLGTGAVFDFDTDAVHVALVPDTAGVDAGAVASMLQRARKAEAGGFAETDPLRRRAPPWVTVQLAAGTYLGGTPGEEGDITTGGLGSSIQVGVRGEWATARLSATGSSGFLFDNSTRWEVAALVGVVAEAADGRLRIGMAAGPGLAGGRTSNVCFLFCDGVSRSRDVIPARLGVSGLGEAYFFIAPQVGFGVQVPVNVHDDDPLAGVMVGFRFEGV